MAITINGNGTITGYTPVADGSITAAKLASGAITKSALPAGTIINTTYGAHATTGMSTSSTSFTNYQNSEITVTKLRSGNGSGGSVLLILASAWLEFSGSSANSKHLSYSLMRDGNELTGKTHGLGNLYSGNAQGYQSSADMKYMDTVSLNAGNYVYSVCIKSTNSYNIQIGNSQRLGTWQILEIAT